MRLIKGLVVSLVFSLLATSQVALPDTPAGKMLKVWLDTFNAGDVDARAKFIREHYSEAVLQGAPPERMARRGLEFREDVGGGFDLYKVTQSSDTEIKAVLQEKSGFGWAAIGIKVDPSRPTMVTSVGISPTATPDEERPAREEQGALTKDVDQLLQKLSAEDRFSGVVLIAKDGKPFFAKAYGLADREKNIPNNLDTKFRIGSMNKMFTSVAIAQLVQQGKLKYTDTLAAVLPDYPNKEVAAKVTIHQLLTHTSGLGDYFGDEFDKKKDNLRELKDYLQFFASEPLQFEPGKGWAYSNAGMPLMGSSAGGGDSTAPDLLRFDQALREHKLINAQLTELITTGKVDVGPRSKYGYGFEESREDGSRVVGHGGGAPGMNGDLRIFWDAGYTVIVLSNLSPPVAQQVSGYIRERVKL